MILIIMMIIIATTVTRTVGNLLTKHLVKTKNRLNKNIKTCLDSNIYNNITTGLLPVILTVKLILI